MSMMFGSCARLSEILVSNNWTTENASTIDMFNNCKVDHVTLKE